MNLSPKVKNSLKRVIDKFKLGDLSSITQTVRIHLDPEAPANSWSFSNKVLAYIQAQELDCRGYYQWQMVDRQVRKGSKAIYIISPINIKKSDDDKYTCIGFHAIPVFPASATEGDKALVKYSPKKLPPLIDIAKQMGIKVKYIPIAFNRYGDCRTNGNEIRLGSHDPKVFFHELAHAIHAKIEGKLKGNQDVDQETIAEFTCCILMDIYGFSDNTGNTWQYISQYSKDPLMAITKSLATVEKILEILFKQNL